MVNKNAFQLFFIDIFFKHNSLPLINQRFNENFICLIMTHYLTININLNLWLICNPL